MPITLPKDKEYPLISVQVGVPDFTELVLANTPVFVKSNVFRVYNTLTSDIKMFHYNATKNPLDQGLSIVGYGVENFGGLTGNYLEFSGPVEITWYV